LAIGGVGDSRISISIIAGERRLRTGLRDVAARDSPEVRRRLAALALRRVGFRVSGLTVGIGDFASRPKYCDAMLNLLKDSSDEQLWQLSPKN
jgi:hypothetical protein